MQISIIVVGRNEGFKLKLCLDSIRHCRKVLEGEYEFETIYVDSDSSDESIALATDAGIEHVVHISGEINSAVARNVGASYARHPWFLFVDGDMELQPEFFRNEKTVGFFQNEDYFSGQFINVYYDNDWKEVEREDFKQNPGIVYDPAPGGLFIIKRDIWRSLGGMKDHYKRTQDFEFGLRCYKAGYTFKRINELLAVHHMISYVNFKRNVDFFKNKNYLYSRSLLYRDHVFFGLNRNGAQIMWNQDKTLILLIILILASFFFGPQVLLIYLAAVIIRAFKNRKEGFFYYFAYLLSRDLFVLYGLFFFHPKKKLNYTIKEIKKAPA